MKKLKITVNGKQFLVDVEVLEDDEFEPYTQPIYQTPKPQAQEAGNAIPPISRKPYSRPAPVANSGQSKTMTSPINGVVLEVRATVGKKVIENEVLFVLEAMKMKTNISAPFAGEVKSVEVSEGASIEAGHVLLTFA